MLSRSGAQKLISNWREKSQDCRSLEEGKTSTHGGFSAFFGFDIRVQESACAPCARVVDENVDPTLFADDPLDRLFAGRQRSDIQFDLVDARRQSLERGESASGGIDDAALRGKVFAQGVAVGPLNS